VQPQNSPIDDRNPLRLDPGTVVEHFLVACAAHLAIEGTQFVHSYLRTRFVSKISKPNEIKMEDEEDSAAKDQSENGSNRS
jgi:hypothetical protein